MTQDLLIGRTVLDGFGCWIFTGAKDRDGYGSLRVGSRTFRAHRYAYELHNGELPLGSVVHHTCAVRACVNPAHLQAITPQENVAEMLERQQLLSVIDRLESELEKFQVIVDQLERENDELSDLVTELREVCGDL